MKRSAEWSYGILTVMLGIVFAVCGGMWVLVAPTHGAASRFSMLCLCIAGVIGIVGGSITAYRARRDRSVAANETRLPSARVLPRR